MLIISQILSNKAYAYQINVPELVGKTNDSILADWKGDHSHVSHMKDSNGNLPVSFYDIKYYKDGNWESMSYSGTGFEIAIRDHANWTTAWISPYEGSYNDMYYWNQHNQLKPTVTSRDITDTSGNTFKQINITVKNNSGSYKTFDLATSTDVQLYGDDNAYCESTQNGFVMSNAWLDGISQNNKVQFSVYVTGNPWVTDATGTYIGGWQSVRPRELFSNNVIDKDLVINNHTHGGGTGDRGLDTEFAISWSNIGLNNGESVTKSYIIGIGNIKNDYKIYFDADGGAIPTDGNMGNKDIQKAYDTWLSSDHTNGYVTATYKSVAFCDMSTDNPKRTGYTFDGWWTFDDKGNLIEKIYDKDGKCVKGSSAFNRDEKFIHVGDMKLKAKWTPNNYKIHFNSEGGRIPLTGNMGDAEIQREYDTYLNDDRTYGYVTATYDRGNFQDMSCDNPERTGYTFKGWYTKDSDGNLDEQIYDEDGRYVANCSCWTSNGAWKKTSEISLYAKWEINYYTIDFNVVFENNEYYASDTISNYIESFDVYINGELVQVKDRKDGINDYCEYLPYNTSYEFKNFKMKPGYQFTDIGTLKGTIPANDIEVLAYVYNKDAIAYYDYNGDTKGDKDADRLIFYGMRDVIENHDGKAVAVDNGFKRTGYNFKGYKTELDNIRQYGETVTQNDNYKANARIKSSINENLVFNAEGDNNSSGTNIQLWWNETNSTYPAYQSENWSFLPTGDGYYFIVNTDYGKVLDVTDGIVGDHTNVQLWQLNWSTAQQWKITPAGNGYYYIASRLNEYYRLDAQGGAAESGAGQNLIIYHSIDYDAQQWKIDFMDREDYFISQWDLKRYKFDINELIDGVMYWYGVPDLTFKMEFSNDYEGVDQDLLNTLNQLGSTSRCDFFTGDEPGATIPDNLQYGTKYKITIDGARWETKWDDNGYLVTDDYVLDSTYKTVDNKCVYSGQMLNEDATAYVITIKANSRTKFTDLAYQQSGDDCFYIYANATTKTGHGTVADLAFYVWQPERLDGTPVYSSSGDNRVIKRYGVKTGEVETGSFNYNEKTYGYRCKVDSNWFKNEYQINSISDIMDSHLAYTIHPYVYAVDVQSDYNTMETINGKQWHKSSKSDVGNELNFKFKYTLTFDANTGSLQNPNGQTISTSNNKVIVTYGDSDYSSLGGSNLPLKTGYNFRGWWSDRTGGNQVYEKTGQSTLGTGYWNNRKGAGTSHWCYPHNLTVYAHWEPIQYKVRLYFNRQSGQTDVQVKNQNISGWTLDNNNGNPYLERTFRYDENFGIQQSKQYFDSKYWAQDSWYLGSRCSRSDLEDYSGFNVAYKIRESWTSGNNILNLRNSDGDGTNIQTINLYTAWKYNEAPIISVTNENDNYYRDVYTGQQITYKDTPAYSLNRGTGQLTYGVTASDDLETAAVNTWSKDRLKATKVEFLNNAGQVLLTNNYNSSANKIDTFVLNHNSGYKKYRVTYETKDTGYVRAEPYWYDKTTVIINGLLEHVQQTEAQSTSKVIVNAVKENNNPIVIAQSKRIYSYKENKINSTGDLEKELLKYHTVTDIEDSNADLSYWHDEKLSSEFLRNTLKISRITDGKKDYNIQEVFNLISEKKESKKLIVQLKATDTYGKEVTTSYYFYIIANEDDESILDSNESNNIIYLPVNINEKYSLNQAIMDNALSSKAGLITGSNSKKTGTAKAKEDYKTSGNSGNIKIIEY